LGLKVIKQFIFVGIVVILTGLYLSGCITANQDIIIDDSLYQTGPRDHFVFNSVKLRLNFLIVNVSYGGGCEEHEFALISTSFMESYPVQVNVVLSHEDNDDPCDAWITEEMIFNLHPLKNSFQESYNEKSGTIIINLERWDTTISYKF
jgi:hypothetical protein